MLRVILLNYKRPENVRQIVLSLWNMFPRITVINNNPDKRLPYWGGDVDVIYIEQRVPITRASDQTENIKLIIEF